MICYLFAPIVIGVIGCLIVILIGPSGMHGMLNFYEDMVGVPIIDREIPASVYIAVITPTMLVVFLSGTFPAWKASRLDPLDVLSGQNEVRMGSKTMMKLTSTIQWQPAGPF